MSPGFCLELRDPTGETPDGNGWYSGHLLSRGFRITSNVTSSSSSSATSTSLTSSTSSASLSTNTNTAAAAPAAAGLSPSGKIGIGVGLALGLPLLIVLSVTGTWCFLAHRRRSPTAQDMMANYPFSMDEMIHRNPKVTESGNVNASWYPVVPTELSAERRSEMPYELESSGPR